MMKCTSTFDFHGVPTPEIAEYKIVSWEEGISMVLPNMATVILDVYEKIYEKQLNVVLPEREFSESVG
ncbi:hypothetical protein M3M44_09225, partial [Lactobacillus johnsonii]|uniref:hypothetical protein n=1 Tax=Lactobacillus johnsonii TaxID=33959 RepID=UPI00201B174C